MRTACAATPSRTCRAARWPVDVRGRQERSGLAPHQDRLRQCHTGVNVPRGAPCETITRRSTASICHAEIVSSTGSSRHGSSSPTATRTRPSCQECHGTHGVHGRAAAARSPTFATKVPNLCGRCHRAGREGGAALHRGRARRSSRRYTESIHGKGLLQSGLMVTATCTDCHTAHGVLPLRRPRLERQPRQRPDDVRPLPPRHRGAVRAERPLAERWRDRQESCRSATTATAPHTIRRADTEGFKLDDHGPVRPLPRGDREDLLRHLPREGVQLGYTKTAKCYDCHGAHDILPGRGPALTPEPRQNVVATCQKCHPGATRRFAGYLTHATHHDPQKYPWLFWTFWGMTGLLVGTFVVGGPAHAALAAARAADAPGAPGGRGGRAAGDRREGAPLRGAEQDASAASEAGTGGAAKTPRTGDSDDGRQRLDPGPAVPALPRGSTGCCTPS